VKWDLNIRIPWRLPYSLKRYRWARATPIILSYVVGLSALRLQHPVRCGLGDGGKYAKLDGHGSVPGMSIDYLSAPMRR